MAHFQDICKHGVTVSQCRCPGLKATTIVECPEHCPNKDREPSRCDAEPLPKAVTMAFTAEELKVMQDALVVYSATCHPNVIPVIRPVIQSVKNNVARLSPLIRLLP